MLRSARIYSIVILCVLMFGSELFAVESHRACPKLYSALVFVPNTTSKLSRAEYESHLERLRGYMSGLKSPEFGLYLGVHEPYFIPKANTIYSPSDLTSHIPAASQRTMRNSKFELAILDHEIGHAVFEANLNVPHLKFEHLDQKLSSTMREYDPFSKEYEGLQRARTGGMSPAEFAYRENELMRRVQPIVSRLLSLRRAEYLTVAQNELFADLTTAIVRNEPTINSDATRAYVWLERGRSKKPEFDAPFRVRDFARDASVQEVNRLWPSSDSIDEMLADPHGLFVPIKKSIWNIIAPFVADPAQRGAVLSRVLIAIRESALESLPTEASLTSNSLRPEKLNEILLRRIQKEFASKDLK